MLQHHPFQSVTLSLFVYFMQNIWSFNFFPIWATTWLSWALSFLINFLSFMMFQVFWASWEFELSKVCEIWVRYKLHASSLLWCLSLKFLALHISHVLFLLGFMILKFHASSPLWCSSFDFVALHYFHALFLVGFMIFPIFSSLHCLQVCWEISHPPNSIVIIVFLVFYSS